MIETVKFKRIRREEENTLKDLIRDYLLAITVYCLYVYRFKNVFVTNSCFKNTNKYVNNTNSQVDF